jgi:hypothetical protein
MAKKQNESKAKKVFESKYNPAKLRELIKAGKSCAEIQKELSIVSKQSMRQHVLRLINEDRTFYEIDGLYERSTNILKAGKYGLKLSPKKLQSLGDFPEGTEFSVEADGDNIILTRLTGESDEPIALGVDEADPVEESTELDQDQL